MRIRSLLVTAGFFVQFCKGGGSACVRIVANALPDDTEFLYAGHNHNGLLYLTIKSASFDEIGEGETIPLHPKIEFMKVGPCLNVAPAAAVVLPSATTPSSDTGTVPSPTQGSPS